MRFFILSAFAFVLLANNDVSAYKKAEKSVAQSEYKSDFSNVRAEEDAIEFNKKNIKKDLINDGWAAEKKLEAGNNKFAKKQQWSNGEGEQFGKYQSKELQIKNDNFASEGAKGYDKSYDQTNFKNNFDTEGNFEDKKETLIKDGGFGKDIKYENEAKGAFSDQVGNKGGFEKPPFQHGPPKEDFNPADVDFEKGNKKNFEKIGKENLEKASFQQGFKEGFGNVGDFEKVNNGGFAKNEYQNIGKEKFAEAGLDQGFKEGFSNVGDFEKVNKEGFEKTGYQKIGKENFPEAGLDQGFKEGFGNVGGFEKVNKESFKKNGYQKIGKENFPEAGLDQSFKEGFVNVGGFEKVNKEGFEKSGYKKIGKENFPEAGLDQGFKEGFANVGGYGKVNKEDFKKNGYQKIGKEYFPEAGLDQSFKGVFEKATFEQGGKREGFEEGYGQGAGFEQNGKKEFIRSFENDNKKGFHEKDFEKGNFGKNNQKGFESEITGIEGYDGPKSEISNIGHDAGWKGGYGTEIMPGQKFKGGYEGFGELPRPFGQTKMTVKVCNKMIDSLLGHLQVGYKEHIAPIKLPQLPPTPLGGWGRISFYDGAFQNIKGKICRTGDFKVIPQGDIVLVSGMISIPEPRIRYQADAFLYSKLKIRNRPMHFCAKNADFRFQMALNKKAGRIHIVDLEPVKILDFHFEDEKGNPKHLVWPFNKIQGPAMEESKITFANQLTGAICDEFQTMVKRPEVKKEILSQV